MEREYFFLYLVYGLVFIAMGIYASGKKNKDVSHIPLVQSLKYLGAFGVAHGLSEWITMIVITELYSEHYVYLFCIKQVLKAISFAFLLYFGISLLQLRGKYSVFFRVLPVLLLVVWVVGIVVQMKQYGLDYHIENPQYNIVLLRYMMGFPGGIISAVALYRQAVRIDKKILYDVQMKYKRLAAVFFIYGVVDGMFVREMDFFPASVFNNSLFIDWFGFPVQILKIFIGIAINYLLIQVINTFDWEQKEKIKQLEQQKIAYEERKKMGLEVHDSIIQDMYAATLKIQYLQNKKPINKISSNRSAEVLQEVKEDLGKAIKITREFIANTSLEQVEVKELKSRLQFLIETLDRNPGINISFILEADSIAAGKLSTKESSHIYYIVQEAINNAVKHSQATITKVTMKEKANRLCITIIDNGTGLRLDEVDPVVHFGIKAMNERAEQIGGKMMIRSHKIGTEVELIIPWR